jgi:hypothetical protein
MRRKERTREREGNKRQRGGQTRKNSKPSMIWPSVRAIAKLPRKQSPAPVVSTTEGKEREREREREVADEEGNRRKCSTTGTERTERGKRENRLTFCFEDRLCVDLTVVGDENSAVLAEGHQHVLHALGRTGRRRKRGRLKKK